MKMKFISQRDNVLLCYSSNMAAANTLYNYINYAVNFNSNMVDLKINEISIFVAYSACSLSLSLNNSAISSSFNVSTLGQPSSRSLALRYQSHRVSQKFRNCLGKSVMKNGHSPQMTCLLQFSGEIWGLLDPVMSIQNPKSSNFALGPSV